jgi:hypothetical protein
MFATMFIVATAAIAIWVVVRFPRWAPKDFRRGLLHMGISMVGMYLLVPLLQSLADPLPEPYQAHIRIIGVLLPAFAYRLVSTIWLIRLAQGSLGSALR